MKKLVIIMFAAVLLAAAPAWALPLALESNPATKFQQTENSPCVIGDKSCNNGGFAYTSATGPAGGVLATYELKSPTYDVIAGTGVSAPYGIPTSFRIGYDINYAGGQGYETLEYFKMFVNEVLTDQYVGPTNVSVQANGNGFSDAIFSGFSPLSVGDKVYFMAKWSNDTDGMEEFFIIPSEGATPVPEPMSMLLLGLGLVGLAGVGRFRK